MKNINRIKRFCTVILVIATVLSATLSLASCNIHITHNNSQETEGPDVNTPEEPTSPSYIQDLIKLDQIFNFYSYDGVDEEAMKIALLKAYIEATGDVHAAYLDAEEYEEYYSDRAGEFVGIGVSVVNTYITVDGYDYKALQIVSVFKDSPALEAGILPGDYVVYVGSGDDRTLIDSIGYTEALERVRGVEGTSVDITVFRPSASDYEVIEFTVDRRKVTSYSVTYKVSETDEKIGIVSVSSFDDTTPRQFTEAMDTLISLGCDKFVYDLRDNPGGSVDSIETVLSYFLSEGDVIVSVEYNDALEGNNRSDYVRVKNYASPYECLNVTRADIGKYKELDSVVLVNENSASAAELFAATFRDYGLAKLVGVTTFGKGSMQQLYSLEKYGIEGGLKLTVARYFSKSHTDYHGIGIVPDVIVELSDEALEYNPLLLPEEKDNQLKAAIAELYK